MATKMDAEDAESATLMISNLSALRNDSSFSDIIVIVEDTEFQCHRAILASASDFFNAALSTNMKEAKEGKIALLGIDKKLFATLLDGIYCCKNILTEENLFEIWAAADMLQMKTLISECQKLMQAKLSKENAVSYLSNVRAFGKDPKKLVLEFICNEFDDMDTRKIYKSLHKDDMKFIIANDNYETSEDRMIGLMLLWADAQFQSSTYEGLGGGHDRKANQIQESPSESEESATDCMVELLECTRYFLITETCLHGSLKQHPVVQGNQMFETIFQRILWYQTQAHLHQSWCPPAAVHRANSDMVNVLLIGKIEANGQLTMFNLKNMEWERVTLRNKTGTSANVLFHDSKIYAIKGSNISLYVSVTSEWPSADMPSRYGFVRIIGKSIYLYHFLAEKKPLRVTHITNSAQLHHTSSKPTYLSKTIGDSRLNGMSIKEVTSIGNKNLIFLGRDDLDNYTIACYDDVLGKVQLFPYQLGSRSNFVTFNFESEVFVLQENGCLWRIRQSVKNVCDINTTQELVLWNNETSLTGAVLYNDELLIVGKFPDQTGDIEILDRSLDAVFRRVRKVKYSHDLDNTCPRISLAVLPKSMLVEQPHCGYNVSSYFEYGRR